MKSTTETSFVSAATVRHVIHGWDCPNIGPKPLENALRSIPRIAHFTISP